MSTKAQWALNLYWQYKAQGMSGVDAIVKSINLLATTWYEYARIYNEIKEEL